MVRAKNVSKAQLFAVFAIVIALVAIACGSDDTSLVASGGEETQRIRMIESTQIFTEDDVKAIGWKAQKDFVLDYPGATTFKWGYLNQTEVGILIYDSAEDAKTLGVTAAADQTFRRESDNQARDGDFTDRISCRFAVGSRATKADTGFKSKSFYASYLEPNSDRPDDASQVRGCTTRYPTYNDYTVIGNVVFMCEGDESRLLEPSTNCEKVAEWLNPS
ncbi:MAG: hypothetical protein HOJ22_09855 [Chloroflexi bacterium]|jgi:hypothetical protein|nr:hypothetical protein [Chloroflexota bacterium]MBT5628586.1 hypothetical protein [Chloroflexota bacterium]